MVKRKLFSWPYMDRVFPYSWAMPTRGLPEDEESTATPMAKVLAANVTILMAAHADELGSNPKLGKRTKLGPSAISRLRSGHNATLKTLEALAEAFELSPWQLLVPILDPKNPPALKVPTASEKAFYAKINAAEEALKALREGA